MAVIMDLMIMMIWVECMDVMVELWDSRIPILIKFQTLIWLPFLFSKLSYNKVFHMI